MPLREHLTQQRSFFHGGVIASLADNAGAYAAFTSIDAGQSKLTVEFKANLLRLGMGERLRAVGEVFQAGRSLSLSRGAIQGVDQRRCAEAFVTMMTLTERGDR